MMYSYNESYTIDFEEELEPKSELVIDQAIAAWKESLSDEEKFEFAIPEEEFEPIDEGYEIGSNEGYDLGYEHAMYDEPFCHNLFSQNDSAKYGESYTKAFIENYEIGYHAAMEQKGGNFTTIEVEATIVE